MKSIKKQLDELAVALKKIEPNHTNHEGKPWNTRYYNIKK
jgi:hypothetical protein